MTLDEIKQRLQDKMKSPRAVPPSVNHHIISTADTISYARRLLLQHRLLEDVQHSGIIPELHEYMQDDVAQKISAAWEDFITAVPRAAFRDPGVSATIPYWQFMLCTAYDPFPDESVPGHAADAPGPIANMVIDPNQDFNRIEIFLLVHILRKSRQDLHVLLQALNLADNHDKGFYGSDENEDAVSRLGQFTLENIEEPKSVALTVITIINVVSEWASDRPQIFCGLQGDQELNNVARTTKSLLRGIDNRIVRLKGRSVHQSIYTSRLDMQEDDIRSKVGGAAVHKGPTLGSLRLPLQDEEPEDD